MKKMITLGCAIALLSLSACGTQQVAPDANTGSADASVQTPPEPPKFETNQQDTPATKYCKDNGGTVSFETKTEGEFSMDIAYCTIDGEKKDAWAYMDEATTATGTTATGETELAQ